MVWHSTYNSSFITNKNAMKALLHKHYSTSKSALITDLIKNSHSHSVVLLKVIYQDCLYLNTVPDTYW